MKEYFVNLQIDSFTRSVTKSQKQTFNETYWFPSFIHMSTQPFTPVNPGSEPEAGESQTNLKEIVGNKTDFLSTVIM